jgi:hypothetical protein
MVPLIAEEGSKPSSPPRRGLPSLEALLASGFPEERKEKWDGEKAVYCRSWSGRYYLGSGDPILMEQSSLRIARGLMSCSRQ